MQSPNEPFRLKLTPKQKAQISNRIGKDAEVLELWMEELEERIAPAKDDERWRRRAADGRAAP